MCAEMAEIAQRTDRQNPKIRNTPATRMARIALTGPAKKLLERLIEARPSWDIGGAKIVGSMHDPSMFL